MDDIPRMKVSQALAQSIKNRLHFRGRQIAAHLRQITKRTALTQLKVDVHIIFILEVGEKFHNVGMMKSVMQFDFIDELGINKDVP